MKLQDLGYTDFFEDYRQKLQLIDFEVARVIAEHKERYIVMTIASEYSAEIIGNLRYTAESRSDFPAVGDWVAISIFEESKALIHHVFPRQSFIGRKAVGSQIDTQIIAANIDTALILQAVDRDFNINRLERYLTICYSGQVHPVIILSKIDLIDHKSLLAIEHKIRKRHEDIPLLTISNQSHTGIADLKNIMLPGKTYCLLGSSGVGKSTLLNNLAEDILMKTNTISEHSNRGRHITTHRQLHILNNGSLLIDTPGMREIGLSNDSEGIGDTFETIIQLSHHCRFHNCSHTVETDCAVLKAIEDGELEAAALNNYLRLQREQEHFETSLVQKRKKDKAMGKLIRRVIKSKNDRYN